MLESPRKLFRKQPWVKYDKITLQKQQKRERFTWLAVPAHGREVTAARAWNNCLHRAHTATSAWIPVLRSLPPLIFGPQFCPGNGTLLGSSTYQQDCPSNTCSGPVLQASNPKFCHTDTNITTGNIPSLPPYCLFFFLSPYPFLSSRSQMTLKALQYSQGQDESHPSGQISKLAVKRYQSFSTFISLHRIKN